MVVSTRNKCFLCSHAPPTYSVVVSLSCFAHRECIFTGVTTVEKDSSQIDNCITLKSCIVHSTLSCMVATKPIRIRNNVVYCLICLLDHRARPRFMSRASLLGGSFSVTSVNFSCACVRTKAFPVTRVTSVLMIPTAVQPTC